jgi:hypothetical protein
MNNPKRKINIMKTIARRLPLALALLCSVPLLAQDGIEGIWEGKLEVAPGNSISVQFTLSQANGAWSAMLNSPDVGAIKNVPADTVSFDGNRLNIEVKSLSGAYSGSLQDGNFAGEWTQPGATLAMNLNPYEAPALSAEAMARLLGQWHGKLMGPGITFNMVFHFEQAEDGTLTGAIQNADAGAQKTPMADISLEGDQFFFRVHQANAEYRGTLDGQTITGRLKQGPQDMELNVEKGEYVAEVTQLALSDADYSQLAGRWSGQLGALTLVLRVERDEQNTIVAFIDSPTQGATGLRVTSATLVDGKLDIALTAPPAQYSGTLDGSTLNGNWNQNGASMPLSLNRE